MQPSLLCILSLMIALLTPPVARGSSLFEVTAGSPTNSARGHDLSSLLRSAILGTKQFSSLAGANSYTVRLKFAGKADALVLNITTNAAGQSFNVSGDLTLTNVSRAAIFNAVEKELRRNPPVVYWAGSAMDGNPGATTALQAEQTFQDFAWLPVMTREEKQQLRFGQNAPPAASLQITPDVGRIRVGSWQGSTYSLPILYRLPLNDRVGLALSVPLNITEVEGANVYRGGLNLGIPTQLIPLDAAGRWVWQVALSGGAVAGVSPELAEGGLIANGAFTSGLSYETEFLTLAMGNHFSFYETESFLGYNSNVRQQISKNGLKLGVPINQRWVLESWAIHSRFVRTAAVQDFYTVGATLARRISTHPDDPARPGRTSVFLSLYTHIGKDYVAPHFRFGTAWKF